MEWDVRAICGGRDGSGPAAGVVVPAEGLLPVVLLLAAPVDDEEGGAAEEEEGCADGDAYDGAQGHGGG